MFSCGGQPRRLRSNLWRKKCGGIVGQHDKPVRGGWPRRQSLEAPEWSRRKFPGWNRRDWGSVLVCRRELHARAKDGGRCARVPTLACAALDCYHCCRTGSRDIGHASIAVKIQRERRSAHRDARDHLVRLCVDNGGVAAFGRKRPRLDSVLDARSILTGMAMKIVTPPAAPNPLPKPCRPESCQHRRTGAVQAEEKTAGVHAGFRQLPRPRLAGG